MYSTTVDKETCVSIIDLQLSSCMGEDLAHGQSTFIQISHVIKVWIAQDTNDEVNLVVNSGE